MIISVVTLRLLSVFKFGFAASLCVFMPFSLFFGVSALLGGPGVQHNGRPIFGFAALVTAIVLGCLIPFIGALVLTLGTLVLKLIRDVAPHLEAVDGRDSV